MVPIRQRKFVANSFALRIHIDSRRIAMTVTSCRWYGRVVFDPVRTTSTNWATMMHSDDSARLYITAEAANI